MLTPFLRDGGLDEETLRTFSDRLIEGGVHGLFPSSSIGEAAAMSPEERERSIEVVLDQAGGRVPVLPGTGSSDLPTTLRLTRFAEEVGAQGAVVVTTYYLKPDQRGMVDYFNRVAREVDIPVVLYHIPMATGVEMSAETVASIAENDNVVGLKDSSADMIRLSRIRALTGEDFAVFQGLDPLLLPSLEVGCQGGMVATPNLVPGIAVDLYNAFQKGDHQEARRLHERVVPLFHACMSHGVFPAGFKAASRMLGLDLGGPRPAIRPLDREERYSLEGRLSDQGFL